MAVGSRSVWWRKAGNNWKTHLDATKVDPHWKLWVYSNRTLAELEWDPWDFKWKHDGRLCHFFDYNTKLGQAIQLQLEISMVGGDWHHRQGALYILEGSLASPRA